MSFQLPPVTSRNRLLASIVTFFIAFFLAWATHLDNAGDFSFPFCGADALLYGKNAYDSCVLPASYLGQTAAAYPMTTILAVIPLVRFGLGGAWVLFGLLTGFMTYALLRDREWWRLLMFLAAPYWVSLAFLQWSPLIVAVALLPAFVPLLLVKPHAGLPILLLNLTWRRVLMCAAFGLLSLAILPEWPFRWLETLGTYDGFVPLLAPLGFLLLVALLRWRDERTRLLLLYAVVPLRYWHDLLPIWLIPRTPREMIFLSLLSWVGLAFVWPFRTDIIPVYPGIAVVTVLLPALAIVMQPEIVTALQWGKTRLRLSTGR